MRHGIYPRSELFYANIPVKFWALIIGVAHHFVHHLADIGQTSPALGIGLGAVATSTLFFSDNPLQNRRAALVIEAILFNGMFGVAKTKTHHIRIVGRY